MLLLIITVGQKELITRKKEDEKCIFAYYFAQMAYNLSQQLNVQLLEHCGNPVISI